MSELKYCRHEDGVERVYDDGRAWTPTTGAPPPNGCMRCHTKLVLKPMLARGFVPAAKATAVRSPTKADATKLLKPPPQPPAPRCKKLGLEVVKEASVKRDYYRCSGGFGSTTEDARKGLVTDCTSCGLPAAVWRVGGKCGPKCDGYEAEQHGTDTAARGTLGSETTAEA